MKDSRARWWSGLSAHAWRVFFRTRFDSTPEELEALTGPSRRFFEVCDGIFIGLDDDSQYILRNYYQNMRSGESLARDIGVLPQFVYRIIHRAERAVVVDLGLLSD